jgi:xylulose-5-phosphate/fructose-6-phosphate phosphoketolase
MERPRPAPLLRSSSNNPFVWAILTVVRSWHAIKYIDPRESGAVLPILHVNGFKISERTIFGCMDNKELVALFSGYGYQVRFVEDINDIDTDLHYSMVWAVEEIQKIQKAARSGNPILKPRWPMLILRTPKVCVKLLFAKCQC